MGTTFLQSRYWNLHNCSRPLKTSLLLYVVTYMRLCTHRHPHPFSIQRSAREGSIPRTSWFPEDSRFQTHFRSPLFEQMCCPQNALHADFKQPGDWFTIIDWNDAYFHVEVVPKQRRYLCFTFQGVAYKYNRLPFSYLLAPAPSAGMWLWCFSCYTTREWRSSLI